MMPELVLPFSIAGKGRKSGYDSFSSKGEKRGQKKCFILSPFEAKLIARLLYRTDDSTGEFERNDFLFPFRSYLQAETFNGFSFPFPTSHLLRHFPRKTFWPCFFRRKFEPYAGVFWPRREMGVLSLYYL